MIVNENNIFRDVLKHALNAITRSFNRIQRVNLAIFAHVRRLMILDLILNPLWCYL
jgi:hypothetical protein